jgi:hypothetical protein
MDYLRRFTAIIDATAGTSFIANGGSFSGGGSCTGGSCAYGLTLPDGTDLPTVITLDVNQIDEADSELAPVFIEKDPRAVSNPPPGFTVTTGVETLQEIR